jgi:hypothetical protein
VQHLIFNFLLALALLSAPVAGFAQGADAAGGAGAGPGGAMADNAEYEFGFSVGNLLPNQIAGVTEIMGLGGVIAGMQLAPLSYAEAGLIMGNGNGVTWKNAHLDFRIDIPIENLVGLAYVGADMTYFSGVTGGTRMIFGGHTGGGVMTHLGGSVWGRADMKFSFSPGTTLYIGIGIEFRM